MISEVANIIFETEVTCSKCYQWRKFGECKYVIKGIDPEYNLLVSWKVCLSCFIEHHSQRRGFVSNSKDISFPSTTGDTQQMKGGK